MAGKGTGHHKLRSLTGLATVLTLPFGLWVILKAFQSGQGSEGLKAAVSSPFGAISLFAFMSVALWYCKLEFDEVILDYSDGGMRTFGLWANRIVAVIVWLLAAIALYKLQG